MTGSAVAADRRERVSESVKTAMRMGDGMMQVIEYQSDSDENSASSGGAARVQQAFDVPVSGISYEEPSPNTFSFNSPYGMCRTAEDRRNPEVDMARVMPDDSKSINDVGIVPLGEVRETTLFKQLKAIAKKHKFSFSTPIKDIPAEGLKTILLAETTH